MTWTYVALSSLIEGLTEFLPISSTGHLIILNYFQKAINEELVSTFNIFIQSGAILAVISHFFLELNNSKKLIINIISAFIPTAIIGFLLYPFIKNYLLDNIFIVAIALIVGGIIILFLPENNSNKTIANLNPKQSATIGLFQALSIIPGTSRALTSILGGLFVKLSLQESIKFSFFIAIPTILAATILDLFQSREFLIQQSRFLPHFIVGFILSYTVANLVVSTLLKVVNQYKYFKYFGYYRILLGIILLMLISQN